MLSDRYFRIFGIQLTLARYLGATPFRWCPKERQLIVSSSSYRKYVFFFGVLSAYTVFLFVQLVRFRMMGRTTDFYYYFLYALTVCAIFDLIAAYPVLHKPHDTAAFMTECFRFLDEIQSDFMTTFDPNHSCANAFFDLIILGFTVTAPFFGFLISCHYLFFYHWPCYPSSLVPAEDVTWPILLSSGILYFYGLQWIWAVLNLMGAFFLTYGWYMWQISHEYYCFADTPRGPPGSKSRQVWKRQKTEPSFRSFEEFPLRYRQFQILHLNFQEAFCSIIMPLQATITNIAVFCNYSLIRYKQIMSLTNTIILCIWTIGATSVALVSLSFAGTMYNKSVHALGTVKKKEWGSSFRNRYMKKFVRSCNPISYGYGRMYVIRMLSVFRFVKHLTRGTFRALLTLSH